MSSILFQKGEYMKAVIKKFIKNNIGATAVEYGLIAALIAVVCVGAIGALGTEMDVMYDSLETAIVGAVGG
jgi:pilus assembly protein Flp/PilA